MGADGGLSFCKVRDRDTAQRLLSPFGVQFDNFDGASNANQSAHYTYLEENEQEVAGYVYLEYGSFCYLPCWSDIAEMLDMVPDLLEDLGDSATLSDVSPGEISTSMGDHLLPQVPMGVVEVRVGEKSFSGLRPATRRGDRNIGDAPQEVGGRSQ